ncbi:MAG: hypothetical protein ACREB9_01710 [Thermoplasmata archaeon]
MGQDGTFKLRCDPRLITRFEMIYVSQKDRRKWKRRSDLFREMVLKYESGGDVRGILL